MQEMKCDKCGVGINERFQRGEYISGTRCLSCGYETFAKICRSVGEVRQFLEKLADGALVTYEDDPFPVTLEIHFTGDMATANKVKVWKGMEK